MEYAMLAGIAAALIILIVLLLRKPKENNRIYEFESVVRKLIHESAAEQNDHSDRASRALREEVAAQIKGVGDTLTRAVGELKDTQNQAFNEFRNSQSHVFNELKDTQNQLFSGLKDAQLKALGETRDVLQRSNTEFRRAHDELFRMFSADTTEGLNAIRNKLDERLDKIQKELAESLMRMQTSNDHKLEAMRRTVDEKLEKTLETRLQKSFETVSSQLESVNKGLGEMNKVASEVGSLQKVLSNTKNRGIMGEIQLEMIISDIIPPHLYDKNVVTVPKSTERVEFALKLPGGAEGETVYLPIDSKFPLADYYRLSEAYDSGDSAAIEQHRKALFSEMKKFAADIRNKYISPPHTTSFGIIFLPTEGLYAEIARNPEFFESLRRGYGIIVAGPTTISALLNSFLVGFKTLAIQKGTAHIEKTLGAAKKEFENFGTVLMKARERIRKADEELCDLVGVRTKKINSALKKVQIYDGADAGLFLGFQENDEIDE